MEEKPIAKAQIKINAPREKVWNALLDPELVKQYLFGTNVSSSWQEGSAITYKGTWNGKTYEDKGRIVKIQPEKLLKTTYWSSMSSLPDKQEFYKIVTYDLKEKDSGTLLTITQENNKDQDEAEHSTKNWNLVLSKMKELLEK